MKNPFDSRQLLAFVTLSRTGSFTQTGRELFLTQSAISHAIRALEKDAGCALINKVGKKILPTPQGEHLLHHADSVLREMSRARDVLKQLQNWGGEQLRLGASATACQYILPAVLRDFRKDYPRANLVIYPVDTLQVIGMFEQNKIDLAFCMEVNGQPNLTFEHLFWDELVFLISPEHPWASERKVNRAQIEQQQFILYNRASYTFRLVEEYFAAEDVRLNSCIEMGNMEAMKELVKLGLGITILPPWVAAKELAEESLLALPLGKRKLRRRWGILRRATNRLTMAEQRFIALARASVEKLGDESAKNRE